MADEKEGTGIPGAPDEIPDVPTKSDRPPGRPRSNPPPALTAPGDPGRSAATPVRTGTTVAAHDPTLAPGTKGEPIERVRDEIEGPKHPALFLAEFDSPAQIVKAAETLRDAGYKSFDVHTPYPIHGMDAAMGLGETKIGWISFFGGLTGTLVAYLMMWWMNG